MKIKFKKLSETAKLPTVNNVGDVGFDLYCDEDVSLTMNGVAKISTNIQLADMPSIDEKGNHLFLKIEGRSGMASKGIFPIGGIIDSVYRGHILVVLFSNKFQQIKRGDKIAQLIVYKVATSEDVMIEESTEVTETNRGDLGFGSSGS